MLEKYLIIDKEDIKLLMKICLGALDKLRESKEYERVEEIILQLQSLE